MSKSVKLKRERSVWMNVSRNVNLIEIKTYINICICIISRQINVSSLIMNHPPSARAGRRHAILWCRNGSIPRQMGMCGAVRVGGAETRHSNEVQSDTTGWIGTLELTWYVGHYFSYLPNTPKSMQPTYQPVV